jgi:hypothetical protein
MDQVKLLLIGDRQTGKSHIGLLCAVYEAYQGKRVLYESFDAVTARDSMNRAVEDIIERLNLEVAAISHTNGKYAIRFSGGGRIDFQPRTSRGWIECDIHIVDDSPGGEGLLAAERVLKIVGI